MLTGRSVGAWHRTWYTPKGRHSLKHGSNRGDQTGSNDYREYIEHGTVRKRTRAVTLSLLVLATTSGVAAVEVIAASPAMVQPDGQSGGSAQEPGWDQPDPTPTPAPVPLPVPLPSVP